MRYWQASDAPTEPSLLLRRNPRRPVKCDGGPLGVEARPPDEAPVLSKEVLDLPAEGEQRGRAGARSQRFSAETSQASPRYTITSEDHAKVLDV
jgi:hypothetical protein